MRSISTLDKKGQVQTLGPQIIALVFAGIVLILGIVILAEMLDTEAVKGGSAGADHNTTAWVQGNLTVVGLGSFADFWEIIVLAIVISVVIGLLLVVFGGSRAR